MVNIWKRLTNLGANENMPILQVRTIRTVNAVSIVAIPLIIAAWMVRLSEGIIFNNFFYPIFILSAFVPLISNIKGKFELAKVSQLLITVIFMTYVSIQNLKIGLNNHPEIVLIGYSSVIILAFDRWGQIVAFVFNFLAYFSVVVFSMTLNEQSWVNLIPNGINSFAAFAIVFLITSVYKRDYIYSQAELLKKNKVLENQSRKISEQAEKLAALNEFKVQLFSIISHDMRGPLQAVNSYFQLLENEDLSKDEFEEILPFLSENVFKTSNLMENMLIWAKSQLKGQSLLIEPVNIKSLVSETLNLLNAQIEKKSLQVSLNVDDKSIINGDRNMLALIIRNVISNAIKFSNIGGRIEINLTNNEEIATLKISDNGIGINKKDLKFIFTEESTNRNGTMMEAGTGLGLKFCKAFVEKMNGDLHLESEENVGTKISIELPVKAENPATVE
ncbi:sensor histidine kinase [Peijinzhouia sedimentorum]